MGADQHDAEHRQVDPRLVPQHEQRDEDRREAEDVAARRGDAPTAVGPIFAARRHDRGGDEEVDEHDAERDRRARGAVANRRASPQTSDDDGRDQQPVLHDVERDVAFDGRVLSSGCASTASPPLRAPSAAMYR